MPQIDPRMLAQAQALRGPQGGNPYMPNANPASIGATPPMAPAQPVAPQGPPPQSGLGLPGQGGINAGIPTQLQPGASNLVAGMPQAQERFSQGQRQGVQADTLRQSASDPAMGKMVGNVYVPASITQHGAKLMEAYVVRQKEKEQKEERRGASEEMSMLRSGFLESLKGGAGSDEDEI